MPFIVIVLFFMKRILVTLFNSGVVFFGGGSVTIQILLYLINFILSLISKG